MSEKPIHIPVLLSETIESLDIKPDGMYDRLCGTFVRDSKASYNGQAYRL